MVESLKTGHSQDMALMDLGVSDPEIREFVRSRYGKAEDAGTFDEWLKAQKSKPSPLLAPFITKPITPAPELKDVPALEAKPEPVAEPEPAPVEEKKSNSNSSSKKKLEEPAPVEEAPVDYSNATKNEMTDIRREFKDDGSWDPRNNPEHADIQNKINELYGSSTRY